LAHDGIGALYGNKYYPGNTMVIITNHNYGLHRPSLGQSSLQAKMASLKWEGLGIGLKEAFEVMWSMWNIF